MLQSVGSFWGFGGVWEELVDWRLLDNNLY